MLDSRVDERAVANSSGSARPWTEPGSARQPDGPHTMGRPCLDAADAAAFAQRLTLAFKRHSHINNVMTHIAGGRWDRIDDALTTIFASSADTATLTPLARNLIDLLWAEGGTTGRIMKPFFLEICRTSLPPWLAQRCELGIAALASPARSSPGGPTGT
jgi:hypothetical protein